MDAATSALVQEVAQLSPERAFRTYADLLVQSPGQAQLAALALREKARNGELPDECIPVLDACLKDAPDATCVVHFAKALAAFGRQAQSAAPTLADKIRELHVTDDVGYWILDGALFALGFLGGPHARALLVDLANEQPNRAVRSDSVYDGDLARADRDKRFHECLERVHALIDQKDPGVWREKKTALVQQEPASPDKQAPRGPSKKSWMVR
jgi:hypothetical protein